MVVVLWDNEHDVHTSFCLKYCTSAAIISVHFDSYLSVNCISCFQNYNFFSTSRTLLFEWYLCKYAEISLNVTKLAIAKIEQKEDACKPKRDILATGIKKGKLKQKRDCVLKRHNRRIWTLFLRSPFLLQFLLLCHNVSSTVKAVSCAI